MQVLNIYRSVFEQLNLERVNSEYVNKFLEVFASIPPTGVKSHFYSRSIGKYQFSQPISRENSFVIDSSCDCCLGIANSFIL